MKYVLISCQILKQNGKVSINFKKNSVYEISLNVPITLSLITNQESGQTAST